MVHMTCCGTRYATVAESMNHTCPVNAAEAVVETMPTVVTECTRTTVMMERHGAHSNVITDRAGNMIRYACQGF
jgi:hypothetical protein